MSIILRVEPYCENCARFDPEVHKHKYNLTCCDGEVVDKLHDTIITCEYADICKNMYAYMKSQNEKEQNK